MLLKYTFGIFRHCTDIDYSNDHHRLFHSKDEFARGKCHVNGIENFWSFAKRRLAKFNGCSSGAFALHLKEREFRYNHRNDDLFKIIKQIFNRC